MIVEEATETPAACAPQFAPFVPCDPSKAEELLRLPGDEPRLSEMGSAGKRKGPVKGFLKNVPLPLAMVGRVFLLSGWMIQKIRLRGMQFARAHAEVKPFGTVTPIRTHRLGRVRHMIPQRVWPIYTRSATTLDCDESSARTEETLAIPQQSRLDLLSQMAFLPRSAAKLSYNH